MTYTESRGEGGNTDRESIDRSIKDKVTDEIAKEDEFARFEREAIQRKILKASGILEVPFFYLLMANVYKTFTN